MKQEKFALAICLIKIIKQRTSKKFSLFKKNNIEYIAFTDILKEIGLVYGYWNKSKTK